MISSLKKSRLTVVEEARKWVGTPYHPGASVIGAGIDCATLLYEVYSACKMIPPTLPIPKYSPSLAGMAKGERLYTNFIKQLCDPITISDIDIGDIVVYKVMLGRTKTIVLTHGAIITEVREGPNGKTIEKVVHAVQKFGKVVETPLISSAELSVDSFWQPKVWRNGALQS